MRQAIRRVAAKAANGLVALKDHPVVWRGPRTTLVGYGLFAAANALSVATVALFHLQLHGEQIGPLLPLLPLLGLGVWLGSKVMHLLALGKKLGENPRKYLSETGFYVQGGIMGAVVGAYGISGLAGVDTLRLWDGLAWGAPLGLVFGRLGCFNYGCCYGRQTNRPWGVRYTHRDTKILRQHPELRGVVVHPSQLYAAASHLVVFLAFTWLARRGLPEGTLLAAFLAYHGISRLFLERFRGDVFFDEGRNWTTYGTAWAMVTSGLSAPLWGPLLFSSFGSVRPATLMSWPASWATLWAETALVPSLGALAVLVVLGFGVHGTRLGAFPWASNNGTKEHRLDGQTDGRLHSAPRNAPFASDRQR